jgi:signal transduction histidine kinase
VTIPSLAVMAAISLYALWHLASVSQELQQISRSLEAVHSLQTAFARTITPLSAHLVDPAQVKDGRFEASMQEVEMRVQGCNTAPCHTASRRPGAMAESLLPYIRQIKEHASSIFGAHAAPTEHDKVRMLHEINRQEEDANRRLNQMSSTLLPRVATLQEKSRDVSRRAATLIVVSVLPALLIAALTAYFLSRQLLMNVTKLVTGTRHIIDGDLGYRVPATGRDEIGQLGQSFNVMAQEVEEHRAHLERMIAAKTTELEESHHSLIQSEKLASIGLLASGVAHELNNPLTSILMNVNLLMEESGDQPVLQHELQRISEDTIRCKRIIDDLRDFSRRQDLEIEPTDLNRLVENALDSNGRRPEFHGIKVLPKLSAELPLVPCDPARMEQVLTNVLVNALQAMPHGGSLTVTTALHAAQAEISVQDTGPGISRDMRGRIFDPFFTTKPQGTGLGLSIVYRIMEAHSGRIEVESATHDTLDASPLTQVGTRIRLFLPLTPKCAGDEMSADRYKLS